jgi:hypothetical protein
MPRNPKQDRKLTRGEIRQLQRAGVDIHAFKRGRRRVDLFKDEAGNVYIKPKSGAGEGESTGFNLNSVR